jgi:hypothetical protein
MQMETHEQSSQIQFQITDFAVVVQADFLENLCTATRSDHQRIGYSAGILSRADCGSTHEAATVIMLLLRTDGVRNNPALELQHADLATGSRYRGTFRFTATASSLQYA